MALPGKQKRGNAAYRMGLDVGSTTAKMIVVDKDLNVVDMLGTFDHQRMTQLLLFALGDSDILGGDES